MQRVPDIPPKIDPLSEGVVRPLWSVMIPVYNCSKFLQECIESVLQQDRGMEIMQIEVVDDHSTDADVEGLVKTIGKGRVGYYRQQNNVGSLRNFETCINRAIGFYIHLLHGDDRVKAGFYLHLELLFKRFPEAGAACCGWNTIDENNNLLKRSDIEEGRPGIPDNWLYKLALASRIQYVAVAVKRAVYEKLGSFYGVTYGEDREMWARIAKHYPMVYTPEILADYREHSDSISGASFLSGKNIRDMHKVINIVCGYLAEKDQKKVNQLAHKHYIYWALEHTKKLWKLTKNKRMVFNQIHEMRKVHRDINLLAKGYQLILRVHLSSCKAYLKQIISST